MISPSARRPEPSSVSSTEICRWVWRDPFNLCDVRDLADGAIAAADKGVAGECYILGNEEVTMRQLSDMIASETGCTPIEAFSAIAGSKGNCEDCRKDSQTSGKKPVMTSFAVYNLERNNTFDYSKAKKVLGYHTLYTETIRDEVQWLQQEGKDQDCVNPEKK